MLPSRAPLLIVPIRDRRQHRRILTIRNCAITMLALAVIFAALSIYNDRRRLPAGEFGRLFGTRDAAPSEVTPRTVDVVSEGAVSDQAAPDPMLVPPAQRRQLLTTNASVPVPAAVTPAAAAPADVAAEGHGMTIVSDGKGVTVVKAPSTAKAPPPVLSGGIFKGQ
ncbi:MAG TPA: hypothetical protein VLC46_09680 [Thermoanaerobaculia bacterium]|jgi:hypothetical protein|nr:hypothetical protein [Thermoanaerobaculia bacterium]